MATLQRYTIRFDGTYEQWRSIARTLAAAGVAPAHIDWHDLWSDSCSLFGEQEPAPLPTSNAKPFVPAAFIRLATAVACHRDPGRWSLLYRLLFRLTGKEPRLLEIATDDDVHTALMFEKAVRRDAHKTKAFVRFREVSTDTGSAWVAFHRPDHRILPLVTPFFRDRFHHQHWTLFTPDASITWDGTTLHQHPGIPASTFNHSDDMEDCWRTYYASTFNPARVRLRTMAREMPRKFWETLPEAEIIDTLVRDSRRRVDGMIANTPSSVSAHDFLPNAPRPFSLPQLAAAATTCRGCDLCERATQTVFGEGPAAASLMLIGEQPGDLEDIEGRPFIGPAGQLLNEALQQAGLPREQLYVTNAVKHFHWDPDDRGKRRLHRKPGWTHVTRCRAWLLEEIAVVKPRMIVCLGVTAAQSLLGPQFRLTPNLGRVIADSPHAPWLMPTLHPAALLRIPDPALRNQHHLQFLSHLAQAATHLKFLAAQSTSPHPAV